MGDEDINNTAPLVATVTNETFQETSMCVVENIEHVDVTAEHNQNISHSASEYSTNDLKDLEENLSSAEKVLEVGNEKLEAAKNKICELEKTLKKSKEVLQDEREKNCSLMRELYQISSIAEQMKNDDKQTHFYTGLPSYNVFSVLLTNLSPAATKAVNVGSGLSLSDELLLSLMKISRACTNKDLGYRFHIHESKVTKVFHKWIDILFNNLQPLVERPTSYIARAQTFSNYKSHNTIKFLVAMEPLLLSNKYTIHGKIPIVK